MKKIFRTKLIHYDLSLKRVIWWKPSNWAAVQGSNLLIKILNQGSEECHQRLSYNWPSVLSSAYLLEMSKHVLFLFHHSLRASWWFVNACELNTFVFSFHYFFCYEYSTLTKMRIRYPYIFLLNCACLSENEVNKCKYVWYGI